MRSLKRLFFGSSIALGLAVFPAAAAATTINVTTEAELESAIQAAVAGDEIVLADGVYASTGISCAQSGTDQAPITVRAANPLGAEVRFDALEGFHVTGDDWHFEDLRVTGVCADDNNCEHAFHVAGASGFVMRGVTAVDFNAQLKVNAAQNGASWTLPQKGLVEGCDLHDTRARNTANPVTKLDMDSGDDWVVRGNVIHDFQKGQGDNVSYAAFLKCGGQRGLMEQNLVLCTRDFTGGTRIGLSLGGGGCDPAFCEPSFDSATPCVEHHDGIVRNNIVANCSDVGVYVNASTNSHIFYNTLVGTSGIDFRFAATTGLASGNVMAGQLRNRDGATGQFSQNLEMVTQATFDSWYMAPLTGDLRKKGDLSMLLGQGTAVAEVPDDYCARTRSGAYDLGALQASLGDCDTTTPPATSSTGTGASSGTTSPQTGSGSPSGTGSGAGGGSSGSGGAGSGSSSSGCGCRMADEPSSNALLAIGAFAAGLALSLAELAHCAFLERAGRGISADMSLIDHITLMVSDYARSKAFYEKALAPLGVKPIMEYGKACGFGREKKPDFWIGQGPTSFQKPEQLAVITPTHIAFTARSRAEVNAFYEAALAAGAKDFGAPGPREVYHPHYYGAFVLDPDGHDIEAVIHTPE